MIETMKKIILMASLAAFALVSCNKDFVVEENYGSKIEFRSAVDTRATELILEDVNEFYVTALYEDGSEYFSDTFTRSDDANYVYESATEYYWPSDDNLTFFAYYPSAETLGVEININANQQGFVGYTPSTNIGEQKDFIATVVVTNKTESAAGVEVEFKHQLSQVEIKAKNNNESYTVKIKEAKIVNVAGSGDFDFTAPMKNWTPSTDVTASYSIACKNPNDANEEFITLGESAVSLMGANGNAMLIPQTRIAWGPAVAAEQEPTEGEEPTEEAPETDPTGSYIAFLIQVDSATGSRIYPLVDGDAYDWVVLPIAFDWVAGYKYTYVCDFSNGLGVLPETGENVLGGMIELNASFNSWTYIGTGIEM